MTESNLSELLEDAAKRVHVGPPPLDQMLAGSSRQRRRHTLAWMFASSAAVAVAIVAAVVIAHPGESNAPHPTVVATPNKVATPPGTRLVGIGHAAIAVPKQWGTNETHCGTPMKDTVIIDVGATRLCLVGRPKGVESVTISRGEPRHFHADETFEIDGVAAERQNTNFSPGDYGGFTGPISTGAVYLPSLNVSFVADAPNAAEVDRILEGIQIVPGLVGVPGFQAISTNAHEGAEAKYLSVLQQAGLRADIESVKYPGITPGFILDVSPIPGTMVQPGETVKVSVVADLYGLGK